jgi:hypothetical protein
MAKRRSFSRRPGVGTQDGRAKTAQIEIVYQKGLGMNWTARRERLRAIVEGIAAFFQHRYTTGFRRGLPAILALRR